jgi:hypothetical protein
MDEEKLIKNINKWIQSQELLRHQLNRFKQILNEYYELDIAIAMKRIHAEKDNSFTLYTCKKNAKFTNSCKLYIKQNTTLVENAIARGHNRNIKKEAFYYACHIHSDNVYEISREHLAYLYYVLKLTPYTNITFIDYAYALYTSFCVGKWDPLDTIVKLLGVDYIGNIIDSHIYTIQYHSYYDIARLSVSKTCVDDYPYCEHTLEVIFHDGTVLTPINVDGSSDVSSLTIYQLQYPMRGLIPMNCCRSHFIRYALLFDKDASLH